jgi:hypothetical protein
MRIRQVRPEFFTDPLTAHLSAAVQVTYIGLWCVADDAGWLVWDVPQVGALLYPYKSVRVRERLIESAAEVLTEAGRLTIYDCRCALVPKLEDHQKIGGNKSFPVRDKHLVHTRTDKSARNGRVGNVTVGNGTSPARAPDGAAGDLGERLLVHGVDPALVGRPS